MGPFEKRLPQRLKPSFTPQSLRCGWKPHPFKAGANSKQERQNQNKSKFKKEQNQERAKSKKSKIKKIAN
jgi:hypothetical protein